jgi:two-component sensor histidine kinase
MPESRSVVETLPPMPGAPRRARDVVTEQCVRWGADHLIWPATMIVSELVSNVVEHARTVMKLDVALRPSSLYLAVHDASSARPVLRDGDAVSMPGGRGLQFVRALSTAWGYNADANGKIVWATLALSSR